MNSTRSQLNFIVGITDAIRRLKLVILITALGALSPTRDRDRRKSEKSGTTNVGDDSVRLFHGNTRLCRDAEAISL